VPADVVLAGVVLADVVLAGVVLAGVVLAGVVLAGVVFAGVVLAGVVLAEVVRCMMASQVCLITMSAECAVCEKMVSPLRETTVILLTLTRPPRPVIPFLPAPLSNSTA
jgi:phosphatidylglycerophosphate synthase